MKKNSIRVLVLVGLVLLVIFLLKGCEDKDLKKKVDALEKSNDSIRNSIVNKNLQIETLNKTLDHTNTAIDSLTKVKNKISILRIEVEKAAAQMTPSQQDSIINTTPKDLAVKYILGYPVVSRELDLANSLIDGYKISVYTLQQRDSLRLSIIQDKDLQIANTEKQRDLYKAASVPKSGAFLYFETNMSTSPKRFELGVDYQIRNKILIGVSTDYSNITKTLSANVKVGFRVF